MEKEIDFSIIVKVIKDYWIAILAIALLFAIIAFTATTFLKELKYETGFKLLIINSNNSDFAQQAILGANKLLGEIYAELSQSDNIIEYIKNDISEMWPSVTEGDIKSALSAKPNSSGFITYTIVTNNEELSMDIATSASRIIPEYLEKSGYGAKVEVINRSVRASVLSDVKMFTFLAFAAGGLGSFLFFFFRLFFNTSIKSKKDIEQFFKYPVLGEIPVWGKE